LTKAAKRKKKKSVLFSQKPKRNRKKSKPLSLNIILTIIIVPLAVWALFFAYNAVDLAMLENDEASRAPISWSLDLKLEGDEALNENLAEDILELANSIIGSGSTDEIEDAASAIQKEAAFAHVSLIKTGLSSATVFLSRRMPIMCINADKLRLLTSEGSVYGNPAEDRCPGPTLYGIFNDRRQGFVTNDDMTLQLSSAEKSAVTDAGRLLSSLKLSSIIPETITHQRFRGFRVKIHKGGPEVSLGQYPFSARIERLEKILSKLKRKRQVAERIELDYQGKAFIKLKKL
jgi:hypothetical protein